MLTACTLDGKSIHCTIRHRSSRASAEVGEKPSDEVRSNICLPAKSLTSCRKKLSKRTGYRSY